MLARQPQPHKPGAELLNDCGAVIRRTEGDPPSEAAATSRRPRPWKTGGLFTDSRSMAVSGLTPGANYQFEARAIGGSTGQSDWSDAVSHMSM